MICCLFLSSCPYLAWQGNLHTIVFLIYFLLPLSSPVYFRGCLFYCVIFAFLFSIFFLWSVSNTVCTGFCVYNLMVTVECIYCAHTAHNTCNDGTCTCNDGTCAHTILYIWICSKVSVLWCDCVPMFAVVQKIRNAPSLSKFGLLEGTVCVNKK